MSHKITVEELMAWANADAWHMTASSGGKGSSKKLEMSNAKVFRVTDRDSVTYLGSDAGAAVDAYNAAP